ncbi:hypothetical protein ANO14919_062520 [Xylariales sp. No.14919]|nr:hypothetical protein ANO14919_062520 [Xylariales sp. No.14919]
MAFIVLTYAFVRGKCTLGGQGWPIMADAGDGTAGSFWVKCHKGTTTTQAKKTRRS